MERAQIDNILKQVNEQEELLRVDHFTNDDAWELGKIYVDKIKDEGIEMAVQIRKVNGNTIFSYFSPKTNLLNENWMDRKFNTVTMNEMSSFKRWTISQYRQGTVEDQGLSSADFAFVGGGFPVKLKNGEMVAVILASNLPHEKDHKFIVDGLASWLGISNVTEIVLD